jgi:hypothetical protein
MPVPVPVPDDFARAFITVPERLRVNASNASRLGLVARDRSSSDARVVAP